MRIVATTRSVAGSIRTTLGPLGSATQTTPGETATPANCPRMWIVALTELIFGSMRVRVFSSGFESQTAPSPAAAAYVGGTWMRATTAFLTGSIRRRRSSRAGVAHRPHRPLTHGEGAALLRDPDARNEPGVRRG